MCSHYQAIKDRERFQKQFHVELPPYRGVYDYDIWPGYHAPFIRQPREAGAGDDAVPGREALAGVFGLIPHWANDGKFARRTFNARSETAATLPSFRDAWRKGHKCIIPADAAFGPDWRSGKAIATRIRRRDGRPIGLAGLWSEWKSPAGEWVASFTMLTINAADHLLMCNFHKPGDQKRMVVVLNDDAREAWLMAPPEQSMAFMRECPPEQLVAATDDVPI